MRSRSTWLIGAAVALVAVGPPRNAEAQPCACAAESGVAAVQDLEASFVLAGEATGFTIGTHLRFEVEADTDRATGGRPDAHPVMYVSDIFGQLGLQDGVDPTTHVASFTVDHAKPAELGGLYRMVVRGRVPTRLKRAQLFYCPDNGTGGCAEPEKSISFIAAPVTVQGGVSLEMPITGRETVETVFLPSAADRVAAQDVDLHAIRLPDASGDPAENLVAFDEHSGVEFGARLGAAAYATFETFPNLVPGRYLFVVGTIAPDCDASKGDMDCDKKSLPHRSGFVRLVRNDANRCDCDFDLMGATLEKAMGTCDAKTDVIVSCRTSASSGSAVRVCGPAETPVETHCDTIPNRGDTDDDGLGDLIETIGKEEQAVDDMPQLLPRWGANPRHKDVFVEVDHPDFNVKESDGSTTMFGPPRFFDARNSSAAAHYYTELKNVTNPDGVAGIALHIDGGACCGPGCPLCVRPMTGGCPPEQRSLYGSVSSTCGFFCAFTPGGALQCGSDVIKDATLFDMTHDGFSYKGTRDSPLFFRKERRGVFHWFFSGTGAGNSSLVDDGGLVTKGNATVLAHELGHQLGLGHHGGLPNSFPENERILGWSPCDIASNPTRALEIRTDATPIYRSIMAYGRANLFPPGFSNGLFPNVLKPASILETEDQFGDGPLDTFTSLTWNQSNFAAADIHLCPGTGRQRCFDLNRDGILNTQRVQTDITPFGSELGFAGGGHGWLWDLTRVSALPGAGVFGGAAVAGLPIAAGGADVAWAFVTAPPTLSADAKLYESLAFRPDAPSDPPGAWAEITAAGSDLRNIAEPFAIRFNSPSLGDRLFVFVTRRASPAVKYVSRTVSGAWEARSIPDAAAVLGDDVRGVSAAALDGVLWVAARAGSDAAPHTVYVTATADGVSWSPWETVRVERQGGQVVDPMQSTTTPALAANQDTLFMAIGDFDPKLIGDDLVIDVDERNLVVLRPSNSPADTWVRINSLPPAPVRQSSRPALVFVRHLDDTGAPLPQGQGYLLLQALTDSTEVEKNGIAGGAYFMRTRGKLAPGSPTDSDFVWHEPRTFVGPVCGGELGRAWRLLSPALGMIGQRPFAWVAEASDAKGTAFAGFVQIPHADNIPPPGALLRDTDDGKFIQEFRGLCKSLGHDVEFANCIQPTLIDIMSLEPLPTVVVDDSRLPGILARSIVCGDGQCQSGETCGSCPRDCGACITPPPSASVSSCSIPLATVAVGTATTDPGNAVVATIVSFGGAPSSLPLSGCTPFPVGTSVIEWWTRDAGGNEGVAFQTVTRTSGSGPECSRVNPPCCTTDSECAADAFCTGTTCARKQPDGRSCSGDLLDPTGAHACRSGNCVAGVCCNTPCAGPNQACNLPGREGTCLPVTAAPAPTLSGSAKLVALAVLLLIAAARLRLRTRRK